MIKFHCEYCNQKLGVADEHAGKRVKCSTCQAAVRVPEPKQQMDPAILELAMDAVTPVAKKPAESRAASPAAVAQLPGAEKSCPSCHASIKATAVLCIHCGYNLQQGTQLKTQTGGKVLAATGNRSAPRKVHAVEPLGFFGKLAQSWEFAKISYGILWDFKFLTIFPIFSAIAALAVMASFILPMWNTGTLEQLNAFFDDSGTNQVPLHIYVLAFLFYFCNYFVIVFFNTALTACAMKAISGEAPTLGYGLSIASKRLPQILAWSLVSALVGVALKVVENAHEKVGRIVAAILGAGWTVLTYFVVPVLAMEGVGPVTAVKQSVTTLKSTWGQGLVAHVALGTLSFLIMLPILLLLGVGVFLGIQAQSPALVLGSILVGVVLILLNVAITSAAEGVFKALLYNYATGRSIPADIDEDVFVYAFGSRGLLG